MMMKLLKVSQSFGNDAVYVYDTNTDEIPLSKELEYIGNFIELQSCDMKRVN
jgi:hypothetical protein